MPSPQSALHHHLRPGRSGREGDAGVILSEVPEFGLTQIAAWPDTLAQAGAEAAQAAGCDSAPASGQAEDGANGTLLRVEPLKWWLISQTGESSGPDLAVETGAVLDLSHSRSWFRLQGPKADTLLNHFLPLDLRDDVFPTGTIASTAFHHVGVTLWRDAAGFNLLVPRSFAVTLWELLHESAAQYGVDVK